jgi:hypothetical protein
MRTNRELENRAFPYLRQAAYGRVIGESWPALAARLGLPADELESLTLRHSRLWKRCLKLAKQYVKILTLCGRPPMVPREPRIVQVEP